MRKNKILFLIKNKMSIVSKETLFNYSTAIVGLEGELLSYQMNLDDINSKITVLENAIGYNELTSAALTVLLNEKNRLIELINNLQLLLTELNTISNLDEEIKDQLYYFYTAGEFPHIEFMVKMPFNYITALNDPIIQELLTDTVNGSEIKVATAKLVFEKYQIFEAHRSNLIKLYRYLD